MVVPYNSLIFFFFFQVSPVINIVNINYHVLENRYEKNKNKHELVVFALKT